MMKLLASVLTSVLASVLVLAAFQADAQTNVPPAAPGAPTEFPADATTPAASAVTELIAGKTFSVNLTGGASWRLEYKAGGYFFVNTSSGFNGKGNWRAQDGKLTRKCGSATFLVPLGGRAPQGGVLGALCSATSGAPEACNDVRVSAGLLCIKRLNGEVIVLTPR